MKPLACVFWALSQDESFSLPISLSPWSPGLCQKQRTAPVRNYFRDPEPPPTPKPEAWSPLLLTWWSPPSNKSSRPHSVRGQGQCHLESEKSRLGPCPDQLFIALEKRWAWDISVSTGALRHASVITGWDCCSILDGRTPPWAAWRWDRVKKQNENVRFLLGIKRHSTLAKFYFFSILKRGEKVHPKFSPSLRHAVNLWFRRKKPEIKKKQFGRISLPEMF